MWRFKPAEGLSQLYFHDLDTFDILPLGFELLVAVDGKDALVTFKEPPIVRMDLRGTMGGLSKY